MSEGSPPPGDAPPQPEGGAQSAEGGAPPPDAGGAKPPSGEGGAPPPDAGGAKPPSGEGGAPPPDAGGSKTPSKEGDAGAGKTPSGEGGAPKSESGAAKTPSGEGGAAKSDSGSGKTPSEEKKEEKKEKKDKKEKSEKKDKGKKEDKKEDKKKEKSSKKSESKGSKKSSSKGKKKLGELDISSCKFGFIGAGRMAECLIEGLINHTKVSAKQIYVGAPSTKNIEKLKALGINHSKRMIDVFGKYGCEVIFLCMHGSAIRQCYADGGKIPRALMLNYIPHVPHAMYILSLVSGVTMDQIKAVLLHPDTSSGSYKIEWHRIMCNAACGYGAGMCAVDVEPDSKKLSAPIRTMLSSFSRLEFVPESQMDAACAAGGNGLAFSYYFINALADGGFKMGISRNMAIKFAAKTSQCAAQSVLESGRHPSELLDSVCAPSGPAVYGVHVLDKADVKSGIIAAVEAAHKRAIELATTDTGST